MRSYLLNKEHFSSYGSVHISWNDLQHQLFFFFFVKKQIKAYYLKARNQEIFVELYYVYSSIQGTINFFLFDRKTLTSQTTLFDSQTLLFLFFSGLLLSFSLSLLSSLLHSTTLFLSGVISAVPLKLVPLGTLFREILTQKKNKVEKLLLFISYNDILYMLYFY